MSFHLNPSDLIAQLFTWTSTPSPPRPGESALECLQRHIKDYDGMSKRARFKYNYLRLAQIVAAALIPLLSAYARAIDAGIAGVVVIVASGIEIAGQYYDKWIRWRRAWQQLDLERQAYLYKTNEKYTGDDAKRDARLMERVNEILSEEHVLWHESSQGKDREGRRDPNPTT